MTGAITRKIEIIRQLEEMVLLHSEQQTNLKGRARTLGQGVIDERLARQAAIIATLEFCRDNEADFRRWAADRKALEHQP